MRKLALSHEILMTIDKPARYIGNEINAVYKEKGSYDVHFAMCFPDVYEIGMSHLGMPIICDMLNRREDTYCERVYSPWVDLDKIMRERNIPLFSLESQEPIKDFDFLGITLQFEMCYTNILQILDLAQIPLVSRERTEEHPIVIGGGPCTYNPEPIADFFDMFYIGEGETVYYDLIDLYKECKSRQEFLRKASNIPGIYVPSLYEVEYNEDGTIKAFSPKYEDVPKTIRRQVEMELSDTFYPEKPLVPFVKVTQDRLVLEIMRGCIRECRFCQAGSVYKPNRERSLEFLKDLAVKMIDATGHEEITLSSLSSSDYSKLKDLIEFLMAYCADKKLNISLPSLRIDAFSLDIMSKLQDVRKSSLTFAPEAGTQRMRNVINKGLTEDDIFNGAFEAFKGGWNRVKLYFMLGLPTETTEDIEGIANLCNDLAAIFYMIPKSERPGNKRVEIVASTSFFVPKPFTPFQWVRQNTKEELMDKQRIVSGKMKSVLNHKSLKYNWHDDKTTHLEGILARGDRKICNAILYVYNHGGFYDAWTEFFKYDLWMKAFKENDIDIDFYTARERSYEEILPWDFIDIGVTKEFLIREYEKAKAETVTPNCRMQCSGCGCTSYKGGVCFESKN